MRVAYDKKNDVVSIYFDSEEIRVTNSMDKDEVNVENREYDTVEAANLILDMIDLFNGRNEIIGFRVFNASKHYDAELLDSADIEELSAEEMKKRPKEKVIAKYSRGNGKIYAHNG